MPRLSSGNNNHETFFLFFVQQANGQLCYVPTMQTNYQRISRVYRELFEDSIKELISRLKYKNVVAAADPLANALLVEAGYEYDLILPVPSSTKRFRQRGYNQSVLIRRTLSKHMGIPYHEALGRFGDTRQVGANRKERLTQLEGMFYVRKPAHVHGQRILLVDDVVTTGTTIHECAATLKAAGACSISAAVVAKH